MDAAESWRGYATMCRLCLQKDGFMLGIFNHIQGRDKSIYKKIIDCTALQISHGDGLPNVICHRCLYKIEYCLDFRQQCFVSDATLRQISKAANPKDSSDTSHPSAPYPLYEQLANGTDEDVVMVVDPSALDYDSEYETDNDRQSDNDNETIENNDTLECRNVSMCKYCDQAFTDTQECLEHETSAHNPEVPYKCSECGMEFADRLQYSAHLKSIHQNEKPYNCPQCERTFARRSDLRKHTIVHTGVKPFTCTICTKSFSRNTNLSKHMRIHSGQKPFVCSKCPKTFISKADLTRHAVVHTEQKAFQCNYCSMSFGRRDKLLRHEKRHFPQENTEDKSQELQMMRDNLALGDYSNYNPAADGFEPEEEKPDGWTSSENMVITLDPFHHNTFGNGEATPRSEADPVEGDYPPIPDHIKEAAAASAALLPPVPTHITGDSFSNEAKAKSKSVPKRYACDACSKRFTSPENLKYHQACHTGIRPFSCNICNKAFIRKRELDRHVATHTGAKPYKCTKCTKGFGRKDKLVRHMRIHDVKKEYSCNFCEGSFTRRDELTQHLKTHVKEEQD